jgi:nucleotide-binding universal stress UspA family protein
MACTVIVSYDGTDNDRDALALGRVLAQAGASLELAYVRHTAGDASTAQAMLDAGVKELREGDVPTHVVLSGSTPEGLRTLALEHEAVLVVFGSEYRTARGHVDPQSSARRLIDGGPIAVALAPAGFHADKAFQVETVGAIGEDGDPCVLETAELLASRLGGVVAPRATKQVDLMIVGSKPGTVTGRVTISAAAEYVIELARCPVVVLPRGVALAF